MKHHPDCIEDVLWGWSCDGLWEAFQNEQSEPLCNRLLWDKYLQQNPEKSIDI